MNKQNLSICTKLNPFAITSYYYDKFHDYPRVSLLSSDNFLVLGNKGAKKKKKRWDELTLERCLLMEIIPIN